jgi:hypothetical protein
MVAALEKDGQFDTALNAALFLTQAAEAEAVQAGMTPREANERFRNLWAFLPDETFLPDLGTNPAWWNGPDSDCWAHTGWCTGTGVAAWRAHLKAERDAAVARVKRYLSDPGNSGVPHDTFVAQRQLGLALSLDADGNLLLKDVCEAIAHFTAAVLRKDAW